MKRTAVLITVLMLVLSLAACGSGGNSAGDSGINESLAAGEGGGLAFDAQSQETTQDSAPAAEEDGTSAQPGQNAKLIRRAELSIQTEAFDQAAAALEELVERCGGYFQSAQVEGGSLRNQSAARYGAYVIRLPEERFDAFLEQSGGLGYVTQRSESSENVSQAYYDTEIRLATQRTKQERLLALLAQADTMESIIALESALSEVEYEIQSLSTDLEHYDDLIDYATVDLYLQEVLRISQSPGETAGLLERMGAGFAASGEGLIQGAQDLLVWLSYHLFQVIVILSAAAGGAVYWRRRRRRKRQAQLKDPED